MAKAGFYAVARGRVPGIYSTWGDCEPHVKGYTGARYKKFKTLREAQDFVGSPSATLPATSITVSTSTSTALVPSSSQRSFLPVPLQRTSNMNKDKDGKTKEGREDEEGYNVVYADGACKGNGHVGSIAGIGVWWGRNDKRNLAERCPGAQTNNRAELIAIARVLETAPLTYPLMIKTDSKYSIQCLQLWHQDWEHRGWKNSAGKPVRNAPLIQYILSLIRRRESQGFPVKFVYVKGHAGIEGNEGADAQANRGAMMPECPERDWDEERRKVEESIKRAEEGEEDEEGPELIDKCIQCSLIEIEDAEDEPDLKPLEVGTSGGDAPESKSKLSPPEDKHISEHQAKQPTQDDVTMYCSGFCIEDLLSPEELDVEVAEALKS